MTNTNQPHLQYGHWGISVLAARGADKNYGETIQFYPYPVSTRGPIDSHTTERAAITHCLSIGGTVKGPFFYRA